MSRLEVYKRSDGLWAWRLKAGNGGIVATDGGQGYEAKADAVTLGTAVVTGAWKDAEVVVDDGGVSS